MKKGIFNEIKDLENKGVQLSRGYNMSDSIEDIKYEFDKQVKKKEIQNSVKFSRKMMMACITGIEYLNNRFDPFAVNLNGWSDSVHENINEYDEVFAELAEKYKSSTKMSPELRLLFMIGGSAFMFHLTNTLFKSSSVPGMEDILKQNPDLMKQFASAALNSMGNQQQQPQFNHQPQQVPQRQMPMQQQNTGMFNMGTQQQC